MEVPRRLLTQSLSMTSPKKRRKREAIPTRHSPRIWLSIKTVKKVLGELNFQILRQKSRRTPLYRAQTTSLQNLGPTSHRR